MLQWGPWEVQQILRGPAFGAFARGGNTKMGETVF
jgi:hypothetical protein